ncbi:bifunctional PIG-L family deacetylase/class I SAM-dependent methyltransferase [Pedococcus dokdonensis]|uniref:bifunctional PIG-L family deacetylase/class I SAM-dependent methyltransferase n=1 Tax=Pedococcus dokdonensis TaxID=443156 RepID=UPI001560D85F|nr:bifunctional PIG-L family deacetylase/class I SAM-dependent methyltransferase [Pedococcus dokdonensis]
MRAFSHDDETTLPKVWADALQAADLPELDLAPFARLVVVAAHPDDESLGAGGLLAVASGDGLSTSLVVATDGEGSHPASPTHDPDSLALRRRGELDRAAEAAGLARSAVTRLGLPDGQLADHLDAVVEAIVDLVGDGRDCLLVAPYRADGHPDHEAMGRCAAAAAHRTGATLAEYPVWLWHAGEADDLPLDALVWLPLSPPARAAKQAAILSHTSQVEALSDQPGDEVLLTASMLAHFAGAAEYFVLTAAEHARDGRLDRLHVEDQDPWGAASRWYEQRKRALLLATLPRPRFGRALEVGCSTGVLTEALLDRADAVVAVDSSPAALELARHRLPDRVDLRLLSVPGEWPEGAFDLVVVSEVGYFLSPAALAGLVDRVVDGLAPDGALVLCHWRHPVRGWPLDGAAVHRAFQDERLPPQAARYRDRDVEIVVHAAPADWPDPHR